jgi:hypothetical protein
MMKGLLFFGLLILSLVSVNAIPNPAPVYCENVMNYTVNGTNCVFPDGKSCELWSFYNGSCGSTYLKNLSCVKIGEELLPGMECCAGLTGGAGKDDFGENCEAIVGGWEVCLNCGDGICDETFEDKCDCPEDCNHTSLVNCSGKGKICGGIAGIECCSGLDCELDGAYPDASGVCVETQQQICEDACGDGECQEVVCQGENCPCAETTENCPQDCVGVEVIEDEGEGSKWKISYKGIILIVVAIGLIILGLKILKWLFWGLAILALILAIKFFVF